MSDSAVDGTASPIPLPLPVESAAQRLERSRADMRVWLLRATGRLQPVDQPPSALPDWLARLRTHPVFGVLVDAAAGWWEHHPLRMAATLGQDAVRTVLRPFSRRHPLALVLAAIVVGAIVVRVRPWRWVLKPALFAGIVSQLTTRLVRQFPIESVLNLFADFTRRRAAEAPPPDS